MTTTLEGGCACGSLRYRLLSPPMFVHCCHCLNCQKHTGTAFVINMLIETSRVELLSGELNETEMPLNGESPNTISRCSKCRIAVRRTLWPEETMQRSKAALSS